MGFNQRAFQKTQNERHKNLRKAYGNAASQRQGWPWIYPMSFPDRVPVDLFMLPPWKGCEKGYSIKVLHKLKKDQGRGYTNMLCLMEHGTEATGTDCYVDDFLEAAEQQQHLWTPAVQSAVADLRPRNQVMFPVAVWMRPLPVKNEGDFPDWEVIPNLRGDGPRQESPTGAILVVEADKLKQKIAEIEDSDPKLRDFDEGRRLQFQRDGNQYDIRAIGPRHGEEQSAAVRDLLKTYPEIDKLYTKNGLMTYNQMEKVISEAWWAKDVLAGDDDEPPFDVDPVGSPGRR